MASYDLDNLAHSVAVEQEKYARWLLRLIAIAKANRRARFIVLDRAA